MNTDIEQIVQFYVALRDRKVEMEARHKEELEPIKHDMELIEAALLKLMHEQHVESFKTAAGTAYETIATSVKVRDWNAVLEHIITNNLWNWLEARVNKTAYLESGTALDAIEVNRIAKVNIRRAA